MKRISLFEWTDQPWLPAVLRSGITGYLDALGRRLLFFAPAGLKIAALLRDTSTTHIVDLASGGGGPIVGLSEGMRSNDGSLITVSLTDFVVDAAAFARAEHATSGRMRGVSAPVDARHVPDSLTGVRTLFNALHHFSPDDAMAILRDAAAAQVPIAVVEVVERRIAPLLAALVLSPLQVLFVMPLSWTHLLLTYVVPVIPLLVTWDAVVSGLRAYTVDELLEMTAAAGGSGYTWEVGRVPIPGTMAHLTYVLGKPAASGAV